MDRPSSNTRSKTKSPSPPDMGLSDPASYIAKITPILPSDFLSTPTSTVQAETFGLCAAYLSGKERDIRELNSHGLPALQTQDHVSFLEGSLESYPEAFQRQDASRPWIVYWCVTALGMLGEDVSVYRQRAMETFLPLQHPEGGFGGGHGQIPHCAATYAAVLTLVQVDALDVIDRRSMRHWLGQLKQPSGAFAMAVGGEIDVRGAYCAMTVCALLGLDLELPEDSPAYIPGEATTFTSGLGEWIARCQTYEGGIGGSPGNEAHGAYAFCALACLCIIGPPGEMHRYLDLDALVRWLADRHMGEGGFAGRANKLVDACYSHWIGGCWPLVEAAIGDQSPAGAHALWDRQALVRYTLACSQTSEGGLRDKPGKLQDAYHTCYSLAGLSSAQNTWTYTGADKAFRVVQETVTGRVPRTKDTTTRAELHAAFGWTGRAPSQEERREWAFDKPDCVGLVHPVFVVAPEAVERASLRFARA